MGDKKKMICQEVLTAVKKKQGKEPNGGGRWVWEVV